MLEASIVVEGCGGADAGHELDAFLEHAEIEPAPVTAEHLDACGKLGGGSARAGIRPP